MAKLISVGQILDHTWDHYSKHFKTFMTVSAFMFVITAFSVIATLLVPNASFFIQQGIISPIQRIGIILQGIVIPFVITPIVSAWVFISLVKTAYQNATGKAFSLKALNRESWKLFIPYAVVIILRSLIFLIPILAVIPGAILIFINVGSDGGALLGAVSLLTTFIGLVVAIAALLVLAVQLSFPGYELIIGNRGMIASLKGSRELVKGRFFAVLWRLAIPKIVFIIITVIIEVIVYSVLLVVIASIPALAGDTLIVATDVIGLIFTTTTVVLTIPLYVIADYLLYDSLRSTR